MPDFQTIFVVELRFTDVEQIAAGLNYFYEKYASKIGQVLSVNIFNTASANAFDPKKVTYTFHFVITYEGGAIVNPSLD